MSKAYSTVALTMTLHVDTPFSPPGHLLFWGGLTTGLCNLIGGASVGVTGANAAVADAADGQLFIKILIVEIFSSIIPMFGLIVALLMVSGESWSRWSFEMAFADHPRIILPFTQTANTSEFK